MRLVATTYKLSVNITVGRLMLFSTGVDEPFKLQPSVLSAKHQQASSQCLLPRAIENCVAHVVQLTSSMLMLQCGGTATLVIHLPLFALLSATAIAVVAPQPVKQL